MFRVFCNQAAAAEELREAGQRKVAGFAERAAAAERQARETAVRLRALEAGQAALQVRAADFTFLLLLSCVGLVSAVTCLVFCRISWLISAITPFFSCLLAVFGNYTWSFYSLCHLGGPFITLRWLFAAPFPFFFVAQRYAHFASAEIISL